MATRSRSRSPRERKRSHPSSSSSHPSSSRPSRSHRSSGRSPREDRGALDSEERHRRSHRRSRSPSRSHGSRSRWDEERGRRDGRDSRDDGGRERHRDRDRDREEGREGYHSDGRDSKARREDPTLSTPLPTGPSADDQALSLPSKEALEATYRERQARAAAWREEREREEMREAEEARRHGDASMATAEAEVNGAKRGWSWEEEEDEEMEDASHLDLQQRRSRMSRLPDRRFSPLPSPSLPDPEAILSDDEVDPLDAYMIGVTEEVAKIQEEDARIMASTAGFTAPIGAPTSAKPIPLSLHTPSAASFLPSDELVRRPEEEDEDEEDGEPVDDLAELLAQAAEKAKKREPAVVDHSRIEYAPFIRSFYNEPPELTAMSEEDTVDARATLGGIRVRGKACPKPIRRWAQAGLPVRVNDVLRKLEYADPTPIQAQALPAAMQGRDMIGVARTGSGKTLAFLLPLLRHVHGQQGDANVRGPVALILTPTRELAMQIFREAKPFLRALSLRGVCAYGGSPIKDQIGQLKGGAAVVVCTPGRMLDLMAANQGRVVNLLHVSFLVLDEADRMMDMGFEPQVMRILQSARPDRQVLLFSATFPRAMEALARRLLKHRPLEIVVGERSVVCDDVEQVVEVYEDATADERRLARLLQLLGRYFEEEEASFLAAVMAGGRGVASVEESRKVLIFVERQDGADRLGRELGKRGYPAAVLHGGKEQMDRERAIAEFKSATKRTLIATSVAARGLDVKGLDLVVNWDCPSHMEDYVHRVGRTGRAGRKGKAATFICSPSQDKLAKGVQRALVASGAPIPGDLIACVEAHETRVKEGKVAAGGGGGFGGRGLERLGEERDLQKWVTRKGFGGGDDDVNDDEMPGVLRLRGRMLLEAGPGKGPGSESTPEADVPVKKVEDALVLAGAPGEASATGKDAAPSTAGGPNAGKLGPKSSVLPQATLDAMALINRRIAQKGSLAGQASDGGSDGISSRAMSTELEINDFPQKARWAVTRKELSREVSELSGVAITTKGVFVPKGQSPPDGQRKLYLFLEAENTFILDRAKAELRRILGEQTMLQMEHDARGGSSGGGGDRGGGGKLFLTN